MLYDSSLGFVHLDIPSGFWPSCHPGKTEDSSANTYGHTCLCDSSTKPTVSPGSNSTCFATVSPMSNIERKSASGKQGPPQSSIGSQHTSLDQILCFIHMASMPKKKHNAPFLQKYHKTDLMDSKGIAGFPLDTRPAWLQASTCM